MKLIGMLPFRTALFGLILLAAFVRADDLSTEYCSTQNTGTDGPYYSIYMSMGACQTQCQDGYAFGIVQGKNCWCGNYIPRQQATVSDCNSACPGFPSDVCGNPGRGMYGYIPLGNAPSGTAGASSSVSAASYLPFRRRIDGIVCRHSHTCRPLSTHHHALHLERFASAIN